MNPLGHVPGCLCDDCERFYAGIAALCQQEAQAERQQYRRWLHSVGVLPARPAVPAAVAPRAPS